jgi:hypothetical protein
VDNGVDVDPTDATIFCAAEEDKAYEYYGYWIPGNARDALLAIFLTGRMEEALEAWSTLT